jgi:hypothetical protein
VGWGGTFGGVLEAGLDILEASIAHVSDRQESEKREVKDEVAQVRIGTLGVLTRPRARIAQISEPATWCGKTGK